MKKIMTYDFFDTEDDVMKYVKRYRLRKYHFTSWQSTDGKENKFVLWHY